MLAACPWGSIMIFAAFFVFSIGRKVVLASVYLPSKTDWCVWCLADDAVVGECDNIYSNLFVSEIWKKVCFKLKIVLTNQHERRIF